METFAVLALIVLSVVVQTVGRMRGAPNVPILFWVAFALATAVPLGTGWMVLNKGEVLDSVSVAKVKDHVQVEVPEGYALLVTGTLNPEDSDEEDAYKTAYTLSAQYTDNSKEVFTGEITKQNQGKQQLKAIQGETISESGKKPANRTGQHVQDRFVTAKNGTVDILVKNYSGTAATDLQIEVTQAPPKAVWLWGFAVLWSVLGIYFQAWQKCDQVAGDLAGLPFYAVFLADGITPTASWFNVGTAFLPGMFLGWGVVAGLAWLATKYVDSSQKNQRA